MNQRRHPQQHAEDGGVYDMDPTIAQAIADIEMRGGRFERSLLANAYGYLWLYQGEDKTVHAARRAILALLDKREQEHGIEMAQKFRAGFGQYKHKHEFTEDVGADDGFYRTRMCRCGAKMSEPAYLRVSGQIRD
jgi:hypothetical protein